MTERWIGNWLTKRVADGTVERSASIATKVNPGGVGNEHPTRAKQVHGYDEEIVEVLLQVYRAHELRIHRPLPDPLALARYSPPVHSHAQARG